MKIKALDIRNFSILKLPEDVRYSLFYPFVKDKCDMLRQEEWYKRHNNPFLEYKNSKTKEKLLVYPYQMLYVNLDKPNYQLLHQVLQNQGLFRQEMLKVQDESYRIGLNNHLSTKYLSLVKKEQKSSVASLELAKNQNEKDAIQKHFTEVCKKADQNLRAERLACGLINEQQ